MEKGQKVELTIEDMSNEGQGIGRTEDGMVVFASDSLPGDTVRVELTKVKKSYAVGRAVGVLHESEFRRPEEWCEYLDVCGGCPLGRLDYDKQLEIKEQQVRSRLERIAGVEPPMERIIGMTGEPERYRNKAVMKISTGGLMTKKGGIQEPVHEPRIGFYQAKTHDAADCLDCRLQIGTAMAAAEAVRQYMSEDHICSYDKRWDKGLMKQMTVRTAFGTGEVMVVFDINGKGIPNTAKLVEYLDDAVYDAGGLLESVVIRNDKKTEVIAGKNTITDVVTIEDDDEAVRLEFEISANSFYQVNHDQMQKLYGVVRRYCKDVWDKGTAGEDGPVILDLYCGIGTIGLSVADIASQVRGIEVVHDAVLDANRNATINGIVNATYECGKAEEMIPKWLSEDGARADIVIVDPPRAGCRRELLDAIAGADIPSIIYVSCDPATLARDVKILLEEGYRLEAVTPVDMFANTGHVESCCLLSRVKG